MALTRQLNAPRPVAYSAPRADHVTGQFNGGGTAQSPGGGSRSIDSLMGYPTITNPWEQAMKDNYAASKANPYATNWQQGVSQAMKLGNRDYEGDLRGFAQEDVGKQIESADNQLGAIGMRELALRGDVQQDRSKLRTDASTRAMIDSQGLKADALQTMQSVLSAASSAELARISQMLAAANAGSSNYMDFTRMALPLQEKWKNEYTNPSHAGTTPVSQTDPGREARRIASEQAFALWARRR